MAYASTTDLSRLGLPLLALADVAAEQQQAALDAGSSLIDSYCAAVYTVPLSPVPYVVREANAVLAAWSILCTVGFDPERGADRAVRQRYEDVLAWLRQVRDGEAVLPGVPLAAATEAGGVKRPLVYSDDPMGW